jgi:hypothetical protein
LSIESEADAAHALDIAEADLPRDLVEWRAGILDMRECRLASKPLDGAGRGLAGFRHELAGELSRADPCHVGKPFHR